MICPVCKKNDAPHKYECIYCGFSFLSDGKWYMDKVERWRSGQEKMPFPEEATLEQTDRIHAFLSYLEYRGDLNLTLEDIRGFGAPFLGNEHTGNPQDAYLLLKAWIKVMEAKGAKVSERFYDAVTNPNEYLNPWRVSS